LELIAGVVEFTPDKEQAVEFIQGVVRIDRRGSRIRRGQSTSGRVIPEAVELTADVVEFHPDREHAVMFTQGWSNLQ